MFAARRLSRDPAATCPDHRINRGTLTACSPARPASSPQGGRRWTEGKAAIIRPFDVDLSACRSDRMGLQGGVVLSAQPLTDGALLIDSLERGERVSLDWSIFG
jgi:hypothetical protein